MLSVFGALLMVIGLGSAIVPVVGLSVNILNIAADFIGFPVYDAGLYVCLAGALLIGVDVLIDFIRYHPLRKQAAVASFDGMIEEDPEEKHKDSEKEPASKLPLPKSGVSGYSEAQDLHNASIAKLNESFSNSVEPAKCPECGNLYNPSGPCIVCGYAKPLPPDADSDDNQHDDLLKDTSGNSGTKP